MYSPLSFRSQDLEDSQPEIESIKVKEEHKDKDTQFLECDIKKKFDHMNEQYKISKKITQEDMKIVPC